MEAVCRKGVLSPLLCLLADELLIKLKETSFLVYGYMDEVAIVIRDTFLVTLKKRMEALNFINFIKLV